MAPQFLGLGSGLASPYGVGVGGVGLPAFGALTLTPASPALRALAAPPLPLATVLLVSNLNEEVCISTSITTCCPQMILIDLLEPFAEGKFITYIFILLYPPIQSKDPAIHVQMKLRLTCSYVVNAFWVSYFSKRKFS